MAVAYSGRAFMNPLNGVKRGIAVTETNGHPAAHGISRPCHRRRLRGRPRVRTERHDVVAALVRPCGAPMPSATRIQRGATILWKDRCPRRGVAEHSRGRVAVPTRVVARTPLADTSPQFRVVRLQALRTADKRGNAARSHRTRSCRVLRPSKPRCPRGSSGSRCSRISSYALQMPS
jgi:hypothetical protein